MTKLERNAQLSTNDLITDLRFALEFEDDLDRPLNVDRLDRIVKGKNGEIDFKDIEIEKLENEITDLDLKYQDIISDFQQDLSELDLKNTILENNIHDLETEIFDLNKQLEIAREIAKSLNK